MAAVLGRESNRHQPTSVLPRWGGNGLLAAAPLRITMTRRVVFEPKSVIRPFIVFFNYCLQSFVFYKASFVCF